MSNVPTCLAMSNVPTQEFVDPASKETMLHLRPELARLVHAPFHESTQFVTLHREDPRKRATDSGHQCPEQYRPRVQSRNDQVISHVDDHPRKKTGRENRLTTKNVRRELDLWRCRALSGSDTFQKLTSSSTSTNDVVAQTDASIEARDGRKSQDCGRLHEQHLPCPEAENLTTLRNLSSNCEHNKSCLETSTEHRLNGYSVPASNYQRYAFGFLDECFSSSHNITEKNGEDIKTPESREESQRHFSDDAERLHSLSQPRSRRPISALFSRHNELPRDIGVLEQNAGYLSMNLPKTVPNVHTVANCRSVEYGRDPESRKDSFIIDGISGKSVIAAGGSYLDVSQSKSAIANGNPPARRFSQPQTHGCLTSSVHDCVSTVHLQSLQKRGFGVRHNSHLNNGADNASVNQRSKFNAVDYPSKSVACVSLEAQRERYTVKSFPSRDEPRDCSRQKQAQLAAISLLSSAGIPRLNNDVSVVKNVRGAVVSPKIVNNANLSQAKHMSNGTRQLETNATFLGLSQEDFNCRSQRVDHQLGINRLRANIESKIFTIELSSNGSRQHSDPQILASCQSRHEHNSWDRQSGLVTAPKIATYDKVSRIQSSGFDSVAQAPGLVRSYYSDKPDEHNDSKSPLCNTTNSAPCAGRIEPQATRPTTQPVVSVLDGGSNLNLSFIYSGRHQAPPSETAWESVIKQHNQTIHLRQNQNEAKLNSVPVSSSRNISVLGITRDFLKSKNNRNTHRQLRSKSSRYPHFGVEESKLKGNDMAETTVKMERRQGSTTRPFVSSSRLGSHNGNPTIVCESENMVIKSNNNIARNGEYNQKKGIDIMEGSNSKRVECRHVESQRHIGAYQRYLSSEEMEFKPTGTSRVLSVDDSVFCDDTASGLDYKTTRLMDPNFPSINQRHPSLPLYLSPESAEQGLSVPRLPLSCPPSPPSFSRQDSGETISSVRHQDYSRSFVHLPLPGQCPLPTFQLTPTYEVAGLNLEHIDLEWQRRGSKTSFRSQRSKSSGRTSNLFLGVSMVSAWTKWSKDRRASYRRRQEDLAKEQEPRSVTTHCRISTPVRKARQEGLKFVHPDLESQFLSEEDLNQLRRQTQQQPNTMPMMARSHKKRFWPKTETKLDYHHWHVVQTMFEHRLFSWFRLLGFLVSWAALVLVIFSLSHHSWLRRNSLNVTLEEGFWTNCSQPLDDLEHSPDCRNSQGRDWQNVIIGLLIFAATFGLLASILSICGVCTNPLPRKIYYFHSAGEIFLISAVSATIALVVFPIAVELDSSIQAPRYGLGYGLGWGAAFFFLAAAVCMSLDDLVRESARAKCCRWCWRGKYGDRHDLRQV